MPLYCYANLTKEQLEKVRALEAETDKRILILSDYQPEYADLTKDELCQLMDLERELGYVAIAIK
jgi:hypothetical protein